MKVNVLFSEFYPIRPFNVFYILLGGLPLITYTPRGSGGGGSSLLYISIAYVLHAKRGGEGSN